MMPILLCPRTTHRPSAWRQNCSSWSEAAPSPACLASANGWWVSGQSFPGWLPAGKGLCCLWAWCIFVLGKYYLHFCVPGKDHPGLG